MATPPKPPAPGSSERAPKAPEKIVKVTTEALRQMKAQGHRVVALTAYDFLMAQLLDAGGADVLLVGDSVGTVVQGRDTTVSVTLEHILYHTEMVGRAARRALVVADMPFMSYQVSVEEALRNAGRLLKEGHAEAVKLEGGVEVAGTVRRITGAGMPVMGHVGLMPQSIHKYGTYKVRGSDSDEAQSIIDDAKALEDAGACAVVVEKVPADLGRRISEQLEIPVIGIGAGPHTDGQILVTHDMLGLFTRFKPRFVRRYASVAEDIQRAVGEYAHDVRTQGFPSAEESYDK